MKTDDKQNAPLSNKPCQDENLQMPVPGMELTENQAEIQPNVESKKQPEASSEVKPVTKKPKPASSKKLVAKSFRDEAEKLGLIVEDEGIYIELKEDERVLISNINSIEFLYSLIEMEHPDRKVRVLKINNTEYHLSTDHLNNKGAFKKLLTTKDNIYFNGNEETFSKLIKVLFCMDNRKKVRELKGFGKVSPDIYHLGNKIIIDTKIEDYQEIIWKNEDGVRLCKPDDRMRISDKSYNISGLFDELKSIYGRYYLIIIGFAAATLFFDDIINRYGSFPLFYLTGYSGSGKSNLAEIISNLFGADYSILSINCDSLSTQIGVDEKSQQLNNLPLILNEVNPKWFAFLKSRFDGQGAIKSSLKRSKNTEERLVKGSTIAISVNRPIDIQVKSRSVFIDLSIIERNKERFIDFYHKKDMLSGFVTQVLEQVTADDICNGIDRFKQENLKTHREPRILDCYSVIGGAIYALTGKITDTGITDEQINELLIQEMTEAEKSLTPLYHLIEQIKKMIESEKSYNFMTSDADYIYFNLNDLWDFLPRGFKEHNFKGLEVKHIKSMLIDSDYIAKSETFEHKTANEPKGPIQSYMKKINNVAKRCIVILRN